jgi:hypothetical protein
MQKSVRKNDPHKIVAQVGAGLTTSDYKKMRTFLSKVKLRIPSTLFKKGG